WRCSFLVEPLTSLFSRLLAVPWRRFARCCFTSSQMAWSFGSIPNTAGLSLAFLPVDLPSALWISSSILLPDDHRGTFGTGNGTVEHQEVFFLVDLHRAEVLGGDLVPAVAAGLAQALEHGGGVAGAAEPSRGGA